MGFIGGKFVLVLLLIFIVTSECTNNGKAKHNKEDPFDTRSMQVLDCVIVSKPVEELVCVDVDACVTVSYIDYGVECTTS